MPCTTCSSYYFLSLLEKITSKFSQISFVLVVGQHFGKIKAKFNQFNLRWVYCSFWCDTFVEFSGREYCRDTKEGKWGFLETAGMRYSLRLLIASEVLNLMTRLELLCLIDLIFEVWVDELTSWLNASWYAESLGGSTISCEKLTDDGIYDVDGRQHRSSVQYRHYFLCIVATC